MEKNDSSTKILSSAPEGTWCLLDLDPETPFDDSGRPLGVIVMVVQPLYSRLVPVFSSPAQAEQFAIRTWGSQALGTHKAVYLDADNSDRLAEFVESGDPGTIFYSGWEAGCDEAGGIACRQGRRIGRDAPRPASVWSGNGTVVSTSQITPERFQMPELQAYPVTLEIATDPQSGRQWIVPDEELLDMRETVMRQRRRFNSQQTEPPLSVGDTRIVAALREGFGMIIKIAADLGQQYSDARRMGLDIPSRCHTEHERFVLALPDLETIARIIQDCRCPDVANGGRIDEAQLRLLMVQSSDIKDELGRTLSSDAVQALPATIKDVLGEWLAYLIYAGGWPSVYAVPASANTSTHLAT